MFPRLIGLVAGVRPFLWKVLAAQFFMNATHFMAIPLFAVYMTDVLDFGAAELGTVMTVYLVSDRLLRALTGPVADKVKPRLLMAVGLVMRVVGLVGFATGSDWVTLSLMAFLMGIGSSLYGSAVFGILGRQPEARSGRLFVLNVWMLNLGVIVGPLIGGAAAYLGLEIPFFVAATAFAVLAVWVVQFRALDEVEHSATEMGLSLKRVLSNRRFLLFLVVIAPWWFIFTQLYVAFPIYYASIANAAAVPQIFLVNGLVGIVFMVVSLALFERFSSRLLLLISFGVLTLLLGVVPGSLTIWWFLAFVALYTVVETVMLPAIDTITTELGDAGSLSTYFGMTSMVWAVSGMIGNYVGSWLVLNATAVELWLSFSAIAGLGVLLAAYFYATERQHGPVALSAVEAPSGQNGRCKPPGPENT